MEDRHVVNAPIDPAFPQGHLLAVFDGHRGAQAADYCAQSLRGALSKFLSRGPTGDSCLKVLLIFWAMALQISLFAWHNIHRS